MNRSRENAIAFFSIFVTLLFVYAPALHLNYAFQDGLYFFIADNKIFEKYIGFDFVFSIGRFLSAYYLTVVSWFVRSLSDLKIVRFISIFQISFCAFFVYKWMALYLNHKIHSFLVAVTMFVLPTFQVLASSTGNASFSMAVLLSIGAATLVRRIPAENSIRDQMRHRYTVPAIILLFCAFSFYQPLATFYWTMLVIYLLSARKASFEEVKRKVAAFFLTGFTSMGIYGLVLWFIKKDQIGLTKGMYNPYRMTNDYAGKLVWFFKEPLVNSLNLWNIFPSVFFAKIVSLLIVLACVIYCWKAFMARELKSEKIYTFLRICFNFGVFICAFFLSYSVNLISLGFAPWYRCAGALTAIILVGIIWAFKAYVSFFPKKLQNGILSAFLILIFFVGTSSAYSNILYHRVVPSYLEIEYVKNIFRRVNITDYWRIHIIKPGKRPSNSRYDEFGVLSSNSSHNFKQILICSAREAGVEEDLYRHYVETSFSDPGAKFVFGEPALIINMDSFLKSIDKFQGNNYLLGN